MMEKTCERKSHSEGNYTPTDRSGYCETTNQSKLDGSVKEPDTAKGDQFDIHLNRHAGHDADENADKAEAVAPLNETFLTTKKHQTETVEGVPSLDLHLSSLEPYRDSVDEIRNGQSTLGSNDVTEFKNADRDVKTRKQKMDDDVTNESNDSQNIDTPAVEQDETINTGNGDVIDFDKRLFDCKVESIDCDMCFVAGKVVSPTSYCYVCQIYLCGTCYRLHSRIPTTCDHSIVHRNDLIKNTYKQTSTFYEDSSKDVAPVRPVTPTNRKLVDPGRYTTEHVRDEDSVCAPCKTEGRSEPGSAFCVTCTQYLCVKCKAYHTKFAASSNHEVVHKHSMEASEFKTFVPALTTPKNNKGPEASFSFINTPTVRTESSRRGQSTTPPQGQTITFKKPQTLSALIYQDVLTPQITGLAFIDGGKLLVADRRNKSLKLFNEKLTPLSSLNVPNIADVAAIDDTTAVVTQPEKSAMLYLGMKDNSKLFVRRSIQTKGSYWGVDSLHGELFALCMADSSSQATIHMLSRTGEILSMIQPHLGQGYDLQLNNTNYFAVSPAGGTFYLSDTNLGVVAIGTDGRAVFSCQSPDIERPCGIQADSKNVYVCCPATGSMVTISPDGRQLSEVLSFGEEMVLPNCIALAHNSSQMAVGFLDGETINVYKNKNQL